MLVSSEEVYITCIFFVAILLFVDIYTVRTGFFVDFVHKKCSVESIKQHCSD